MTARKSAAANENISCTSTSTTLGWYFCRRGSRVWKIVRAVAANQGETTKARDSIKHQAFPQQENLPKPSALYAVQMFGSKRDESTAAHDSLLSHHCKSLGISHVPEHLELPSGSSVARPLSRTSPGGILLHWSWQAGRALPHQGCCLNDFPPRANRTPSMPALNFAGAKNNVLYKQVRGHAIGSSTLQLLQQALGCSTLQARSRGHRSLPKVAKDRTYYLQGDTLQAQQNQRCAPEAASSLWREFDRPQLRSHAPRSHWAARAAPAELSFYAALAGGGFASASAEVFGPPNIEPRWSHRIRKQVKAQKST